MTHIDFYIGDVHGRSDLLRRLIPHLVRHAAIRGGAARFTFLGDIIDRGPDSAGCMEVVHQVISSHPGSVLLLGNHERFMLSALDTSGKSEESGYWALNGGLVTIDSYAGRRDISRFFRAMGTTYAHHVAMLRAASTMIERDGLVAVHAGVDRKRPLEDQDIETLTWMRDPFLETVDPHARPVVHGHTIVGKRPVVTENRISLDTGSVKYGLLSAMIVEPATWSVSFVQAHDGGVRYVDPIRVDRGHGTLLDDPTPIFKTVPARKPVVAVLATAERTTVTAAR